MCGVRACVQVTGMELGGVYMCLMCRHAVLSAISSENLCIHVCTYVRKTHTSACTGHAIYTYIHTYVCTTMYVHT